MNSSGPRSGRGGQGRAKRARRVALRSPLRSGYPIELRAKSHGQQPPLGFGTASWSEAAVRCTTERHKTHKTESAKVIYPWHPFYECEVRVHGERNRRGSIVLICSAGDEMKVPVEVPVWMFDTALCCGIRSGQNAHVTCE